MKYRRLGSTGLLVSEISLGSWLTYGNAVDDKVAIDTIATAYDLGINFFDTANVYNRGAAEIVVGEALRNYARESYVLATKVYFPMSDRPNDSGLSRKHIMESVRASLKRLKLDYVDILYCHRFDPNTPLEETLRAFDDLIAQGKVLYGGISEWTAVQIEQAARIADAKLLRHFVVNQPRYNMLNRSIEEEVIPASERNGIGQVVFSPLAQGVLTGKYLGQKEVPKDSRAANDKMNSFIKGYLNPGMEAKVAKLKEIADRLGMPLSRLALAWILRLDNISSALVGASRPSQIEENAKASGVYLDEDTLMDIEEALNEA
ncbi:MAG: aldo/keto reductase [Clostridiales bacterium]|jgi:voltage-dependent potassium channel beta subunit|nr:aldo/keto reductase [Clostridiales bacterium]